MNIIKKIFRFFYLFFFLLKEDIRNLKPFFEFLLIVIGRYLNRDISKLRKKKLFFIYLIKKYLAG